MTKEQGPAANGTLDTTGEVDNGNVSRLPLVEAQPAVPDVATLFVGSLLWGADASVLALVLDDDLESPALSAVLGIIRDLAGAGCPHGPQLVADELRRIGALTRPVAGALREATTSGAERLTVRHYGAAVLAESLRRRVDVAGHGLVCAARECPEADLAPMAARCMQRIADCAARLQTLRGETL